MLPRVLIADAPAAAVSAARLVLATGVSPAVFALVPGLVVTAIGPRDAAVVVVATGQTPAHYATVARKAALTVVDGLSDLYGWNGAGAACSPLDMLDRVAAAPGDGRRTVVVLDDIVPLLATPGDVLRAIERLQLRLGPRATVVVCAPADEALATPEYRALLRTLAHRSAACIALRPLASGYSCDLDAELLVHDDFGHERCLVRATDAGFVYHAHGAVRGTL